MKAKHIFLSGLAAIAMTGLGVTGYHMVSGESVAAQSASAKAIVDKAKADGLIGETAAGYLALVKRDASPQIVNAMNEINIGRKSVYTRLARQQNVQVEVVAALTGEKQIAKAPRGRKIMNKQGQWVTVR